MHVFLINVDQSLVEFGNNELTDTYSVGSNVVDIDYIKSEKYKMKFRKIANNLTLNQAIYERCKAILIHQNGKNTEDLCILKYKDGELVAKSSSKEEYQTFYSEEMKQIISEYKKGELISIHNHGTNLPPSGADLAVCGYRGYRFGIVACNNGDVYYYDTNNAKPFLSTLFDSKVEEYAKEYYNGDKYNATFQVLDEFEKQYGVEWRKL